MSTVLFDTPGPRALRRYRTYSLVTLVVGLGLLALVGWQMNRTGQFAYAKWEYFVTPSYLETILLDGILKTLQAAVVAIAVALALGMVFGAGKLSDHALVRWPSWAFVEFFRAVPLLLLIIYVYYLVGVGDGIGALWSLVIGLALYNGAVLAEIVRAGVNSLPSGQAEAAYAIGMRKSQVMRIILLPQAIKTMLPAMISQFVVCLKDTSLGYAIVAPGLTVVFKQIAGEGRNQVQSAIVLAVVYIALNMIISAIATWAQRRYVGDASTSAGTGTAPQDGTAMPQAGVGSIA